MKNSRGIQFVLTVVFFLVLGTFSTGFADKKKVLVQPQKKMVQKVRPSATKVIAVKSLPDLSVLSIKTTPTNPTTSDEITITADIKNIGQIKSPVSFLKVQIDRKFYPLIRVPSLAINQNWKYTKKVNIKRPGNSRVTAIINPGNKIAEKNYKNNSQSKSFQIRKTLPSQPPTPSAPASIENSTKSKYGVGTSEGLTKILENKSISALPDNMIRAIKINSAEYLGQGQWNIEIKNTGNVDIYHNQISVYAKYYVPGSGPVPESGWFKNKTRILPDQTETIAGFGLNQNGECGSLTGVDFYAYDPVNNRTDALSTRTQRPESTIENITIRNSAFACNLINVTPYPIKVKIRIEEIEIWDAPKPYPSDNSVWGTIKDLVYEDGPGIDYDTSGFQPPVLKCRATNIELGTVTLPAATSASPYSGAAVWGMSAYQLNQLLIAKCPGADFGSYSYKFKNLRVKLYTENINRCNRDGNSTYTGIDTETITEGGSQADPAFIW